MRDEPLALNLSFHLEQSRLDERSSIPLADTLPDDQIRMSRLILDRHKGYPARAARTLPRDDDTGHAHRGSILNSVEFSHGHHASLPQPIAQQGHGMTPERQSGRVIIRDEILSLGRRSQHRI